MKDEEKKNEYPVPSGGTVLTSYILFLIVMIFMLVFCALFLSSASAEANYMVGGGVIKGSGEMSSIAIGRQTPEALTLLYRKARRTS